MQGRVMRICIVNAPFWFFGAWKGIASLLPKTISEKVQISPTGRATQALLQFIDEDELPVEYLGDVAAFLR